jgi:DNA-binding LytR/AlgR family response regulator
MIIYLLRQMEKIISKSLCKDICYIEGLKNYVAIHLNDKQIITIILKSIEDFLPASECKTHKSFLVALRHIHKTDSLSFILTVIAYL